jgi:hypothetical protein
MTRGMAGSLKIPLSWINEAKVIVEKKKLIWGNHVLTFGYPGNLRFKQG